MKTRQRVLLAMSGGVDSSVAGGLLRAQGHEVVGVTLHLWDAQGEAKVGRCCAPEDRRDARRSADALGIPHYVLDEREAFGRDVVEPFVREYQAGRTPSPCVHCNRTVKLTYLFHVAERFDCTHVATGHYARVVPRVGGYALLRGRDRQKDQSYFLFGIEPPDLGRLLFPLGEMVKDQSRQAARELGLPNADKPDSQELCFVPDGDIAGFVGRRAGSRRGEIVDQAGEVLGHHPGIAAFTVGQRRGLGLGGGPARYVLRVLADRGQVVVGPEEALMSRQLQARETRWLNPPPEPEFEAEVRIRYRHSPAPARVRRADDGSFSVRFAESQRAIAPGQAVVVYRGEEVLGGGFIQ